MNYKEKTEKITGSRENGQCLDNNRPENTEKVAEPGMSAVDSLSGLLAGQLPDDYDAESMRKERLEEKYD